MGKLKGIFIILITLIIILLIFCSSLLYKNMKAKDEYNLLNQMKKDEQALIDSYSSHDFTSKEWIERYRDVGITFINYVCEYGGNKKEVLELTDAYRIYGEKIVEISDLLDNGDNKKAKLKLEELTDYANEIESKLGELYEKYS